MKEIFTMWKYPKMIVLTIVSAALYTLMLVPFKGFVLIPGIAEMRPAAMLPPIVGILFGPAGAWGCAIGNTFADYLGGTLTMGSYFGAIGNFCFAFVAYCVWMKFDTQRDSGSFSLASAKDWGRYVPVCVLSCSTVAFIIAWGLEYLELSPFAALGSIILVNNLAATIVLGPFLFKLFLSRSAAWNLLWFNVMSAGDRSGGRSQRWASRLVWTGAVGGLTVGLLVSHLLYQNPFLDIGQVATMDPSVVWLAAPFLLILLIGLVLA
jgi:energy-coupling factor transport system substrate-specific component